MNGRKFYDYILENFRIDGTAARLVNNIAIYVEQYSVNTDNARVILTELLDGAFGLEAYEIEKFNA